jgi:succinate-semialdehyde dehydrogenase / glutarate-semialdehyde dehydrogenase
MYQSLGLFIGGTWRATGAAGVAEVASPATEKPLGQVAVASTVDTAEAIDAAASGLALRRAAGFNAGHFFEPTVLTNVTYDMGVFAEENFGPIAAITRFHDEDEVLARANASDMGLSAHAFTRDPGRTRRTDAALKAGMVGINSFAMAAAEALFGGTNQSGTGREGGSEGIGDCLDTKLAQVVFYPLPRIIL